MGKNKISIELKDYRTRQFSFYKRRTGLLKKAMELSILCNVDIVLHIAINISPKDNLFFFSNKNVNESLSNVMRAMRTRTSKIYFKNDYQKIFEVKKQKKNLKINTTSTKSESNTIISDDEYKDLCKYI